MHQTYLTADLPGIGGRIKDRPEDFLVDEQPLYEPSGQGEHVYLLVEKSNVTTMEAVRRLAKAFNVDKRDVGYAGLKDKLAITRQHFSIYQPKKDNDAQAVASLEGSPLKVHWAARHDNKLRRGHHAGNRFAIRIRGTQLSDIIRARKILDRLTRTGVPNYVGPQRFGFAGRNDQLGLLLLKGQWQELLDLMLGTPHPQDSDAMRQSQAFYREGKFEEAMAVLPSSLRQERLALDSLRRGRQPQQAVMAMDQQHRDFLISALQSAIFNKVLSQRVRDGLFDKLVPGDLAWKHDSRAVFAVDQATADLENSPEGRVAQQAVSPSGPLWGPHMTRAAGQVLEWETSALESYGLSPDDLSSTHQAKAEGARRPMRLILRYPDISAGSDEHGPYIRVAFELDRGGFATVVLSEIMKPAGDAPIDTSSESDQAS